MQRRLFPAGLAAASLLVAAGRATEPPNLDPHKEQIRAYVKSGEYERDVAAVAARARAWIEARAKSGGPAGRAARGGRLAVVFDLDETLLSNWPEMDREDLGFEPAAFAAWTRAAKCPAIEPVRQVYEQVRRLGIEAIYLTSRREADRAATERNLRAAGCADGAVLVCQPDDSTESAARFKTAARARLESEGWTIIANIGDQQSDLTGGHAERTFKLPDPFYLTK